MIKKKLEKTKQYLEKTVIKSEKLLLALSGGADSMTLFYLLLEQGWKFEVCHVNHGWREQSFEEALKLEELTKKHGVKFHLLEIPPSTFQERNLEDQARKKRFEFFQKVYQEGNFNALLTGHHADDQVETILKRVFEGSYLDSLSAMKEDDSIYGMRIIRPLLSVYKYEILDFAKSVGFFFFEDHTNKDPKFLRSRMRMEMIPYLEKVFGKGIKDNILLLGKRVDACMQFVNKRVTEKAPQVLRGPLGFYMPISFFKESFECEALLREVFKNEDIEMPRGEIEKLVSIILANQGSKKVVKKGWTFIFERDYLFFLTSSICESYSLSSLSSYRPPDDWRAVFSGSAAIFLPEEKCTLRPPDLKSKLPNGVELKNWYRIHKVPVFLRSWMPVIWSNNTIVGECLTGKSCLDKKPVYANHLLTLK